MPNYNPQDANGRGYKRPNADEFREIVFKCNGNLTKVAEALGVHRATITDWQKQFPEFRQVVHDSRKKMFDKCLDMGYALCMGIPEIDPKTNKIIGWIERPDSGMIRYLMGKIGHDEGFGDSIDITTNGESVNNGINFAEVIAALKSNKDEDEKDKM